MIAKKNNFLKIKITINKPIPINMNLTKMLIY